MSQLPVYFFGNCTLLQHNCDSVVGLRQWRNEYIHVVSIADPRRGNIDLIAVDGCAIAQRLRDQGQNGRVGWNQVGEPRTQQRSAPHIEERLGRDVDVDHHALHVDREQRLGERVQHLGGVRTASSLGARSCRLPCPIAFEGADE